MRQQSDSAYLFPATLLPGEGHALPSVLLRWVLVAFLCAGLFPGSSSADPTQSPAVPPRTGCEQSGCHTNFAERAFLHKPLRDGTCEACHLPNPGKSAGASASKCPEGEFTAALGEKGCAGTDCHSPLPEFHEKEKDSSLDPCLRCHDPHAGASEALLKGTEEELCLACHEKELVPPLPRKKQQLAQGQEEEPSITLVRHGPYAEGKCSPCHPAHEMDTAYLLRGDFPKSLYTSLYTPSTYSACYEAACHGSELTEEARTDSATRFRNGDDNLHYLHVAAGSERGRSCRLCHEPHQALNAALIRTGMPFGKKFLTLEFTSTPNGGTCETSCHASFEYNRKIAIIPPKPYTRKSP